MVPVKTTETDVVADRRLALFGRDWLWGLLLILAVIVAYVPVWWAGFIWDDDFHLTANPCIVGPLGLKEIWTTKAASICPLVLTTFWMEHALWGLSPLPYHLVNVFLHGLNAMVLWRVLLRLGIPGAWLGAALWALHPVQVESVAWITEMKNTQSCLFYLLSVLFFLRWLQAAQKNQPSGWNYACSLLFAAMAMASKSSTVVLPVVLCLCAWWMEGRWNWRTVTKVWPVFAMAVVAGLLPFLTLDVGATADIDSLGVRSWAERFVTAGDAIWFYLGKLLWPHPLIAVYPRWKIDAGNWVSYLPLLGVVVLLLYLWLKRKTWARPWFFAFAYFLAALIPVLGFVDNTFLRLSFVADHFQYLADMAPLALVGFGMVRLGECIIPKRTHLRLAFAGGVLLLLGIMTSRQAWIYQSEQTLWTDTMAKNPKCSQAFINLGNVFLQKRQSNEAMAQYQKALELQPNKALIHIDLGDALIQEGQLDQALAQYQKALEIKPNFAEAYYDLGVLLSQKGQWTEAITQYKKALEIKPNLVNAHVKLGHALAQQGQMDEAIFHYQKAVEIMPGNAETHDGLALSYLQKGRIDEAMTQLQKALEINPDDGEANKFLGKILVQKGQFEEAIIRFQKTSKINPNDVETHCNLGALLFRKGQIDEALAQFQNALAINPNYPEAHNNLGIVFAQQGRTKEAIDQFNEALLLKPDFLEAQRSLEKAKASLQQPAGAPK